MEGLEQRDVEYIVNACIRWKSQTISHIPNPLHHLERLVILRTQLATAMGIEGGHGPVKKTQPIPFPHRIYRLATFLVVLELV